MTIHILFNSGGEGRCRKLRSACEPFRAHPILQRLHHYISVPLTPEMTELLAKIMAQILSILALSTKTMKERRISWSIQSI